jgi:hypothetical protein
MSIHRLETGFIVTVNQQIQRHINGRHQHSFSTLRLIVNCQRTFTIFHQCTDSFIDGFHSNRGCNCSSALMEGGFLGNNYWAMDWSHGNELTVLNKGIDIE